MAMNNKNIREILTPNILVSIVLPPFGLFFNKVALPDAELMVDN
jgi:hypothetical protein